MRRRVFLSGSLAFSALLLFAMFAPAPAPATVAATSPGAQKMKPEELVAKHLDSIGTPEARAANRNRIMGGLVTLSIRQGGNGNMDGRALMASEGQRNMIQLAFASAEYPFEKFSYDGKNFMAKSFRDNVRSPLARFFISQGGIFKEGLVGGALNTAWPLNELATRNPKIEYNGMKKVGDRQAHELKYSPRKGSDFKIKLYFDAENFRHLRTEYDRTIAATMGPVPGASAGRLETRYKLVEEFADFKAEEGLTLPHTYRLELQIQSGESPLLLDWVMQLNDFKFNQTMSEKDFDVEK